MVIDFLGTLLFLVSVVGALGVLIALVYGVFSRQSGYPVLLISRSVWLVVYSVLLVVASLLTPQQVLESHQERCFDEMCFSVLQATTQSTVGNGEQTQTAQGQFYVVTVQLRNASQRTAQKPDHPAFFLDDGQGRHFPRRKRRSRRSGSNRSGTHVCSQARHSRAHSSSMPQRTCCSSQRSLVWALPRGVGPHRSSLAMRTALGIRSP